MASITIDEAARYLNVSTRTISTYISQGILSYHKKQGSNRKYINTTEIHDFKLAKEDGEFSIKKFRELQVRVRKLESQLEVLMRILDAKQLPLRLSDEEADEMFNAALDSCSSELSLDYIDAWLPILMRLDETDLQKIEKVCKTDKPWVPFLDLCISLIVFTLGHKNYNTSLVLQGHHKELSEARRRIRLAALLFVEGRGPKQQIDSLVIKAPSTTTEIVKKIIKNQS